jgi:3-isopropylmalate/(R)-2-methylmalate dehydratase small subunit
MNEPIRIIRSRTAVLPVDDVDTDQIIPARFLKGTTRAGLGARLFADWRYDAEGRPRADFFLNRPEAVGAEVLVAGRNFGCGSSREHAPWALRDHGFRAVVSTSFADIFRNNALKNGVLPIVVDPATHARLFDLVDANPDARLTVDLAEQGVLLPDGSTLDFEIDPFAKRMLLAGTDEIGYVAAKLPAIEAWEAAHPARVDTRIGMPPAAG